VATGSWGVKHCGYEIGVLCSIHACPVINECFKAKRRRIKYFVPIPMSSEAAECIRYIVILQGECLRKPGISLATSSVRIWALHSIYLVIRNAKTSLTDRVSLQSGYVFDGHQTNGLHSPAEMYLRDREMVHSSKGNSSFSFMN